MRLKLFDNKIMIRFLSLQLIFGIICLRLQYIRADTRELSAQELCRNPLVTSATTTPYGVICLIPKPVDTEEIEKRQQFVRSLPKLLKAEQNEQLQAKLIPNFKLIQNQFNPLSNVLTKRSIFSNWFQKFYEPFYKMVFKSLQKNVLRFTDQQSDQQRLPQHQHQQQYQEHGPLPLVSPDQLIPEGQTIFASQLPMESNGNPFLGPQESQFDPNFFQPSVQKPFPGQDFSQSIRDSFHSTPDLNSDMSGESHPFFANNNNNDNNQEISENEPAIDESRLGPAIHDLPQYNYGSVRQLASYLQSIQSKINRQKFANMDEEDKQTESSESINDYSSLSADSTNDKHEFVIPLYTDVRVRDKSWDKLWDERSARSEPEEVRRPRKLVQEFHGFKRDMDCKGRFKPLKSDTDKEQPMTFKSQLPPQTPGLSRRKRFIELDYSQMQLRKLPVWFHRDSEDGSYPEAIVEVKPRSLFRYEQPMIGWKPIVPPEEMRKDMFLKRNGDPLENWDHEQVESQNSYQWLRPDLNYSLTNDYNTTTGLTSAETMTIEALKNLDLSKTSVVVDRRSHGNQDYNQRNRDYYSAKEKPIYDKTNPNKYIVSTDKPVDNEVITSEPQMLSTDWETNAGIKAVEVENVGEDITKIRSLEEIAALPGAVIKPIDPKLTDILLKVLSHNSDFATKRITNAYFLEFPKLPNYRPSADQKSSLNYLTPEEYYKQTSVADRQTPVETTIDQKYDELDYDKDIQLTDADYEYGEMVCSNRINGAVADVRKGCRIYFQCTPYTIDTYVCPRGSTFDDKKQYCLPSNQVICGTNYS